MVHGETAAAQFAAAGLPGTNPDTGADPDSQQEPARTQAQRNEGGTDG